MKQLKPPIFKVMRSYTGRCVLLVDNNQYGFLNGTLAGLVSSFHSKFGDCADRVTLEVELNMFIEDLPNFKSMRDVTPK
jgi:hypothetical protein